MIIEQPGKVTENILFLGRNESCVYLVHTNTESALLGGGMAYIAPDIIRQLDDWRVDERRIRRICILHSHFDHCGAVPFLKRRWPWARVTASQRARELLSRSDISASIARMNQDAIVRRGLQSQAETLGYAFTGVAVEETVGEGDVLSVGDMPLEVMAVPGHSSCSIAFYMPSVKALFASDAVGLARHGVIHPTPNANYDQYQSSLERLARLEVDILLLEHFGVYLGQDAHRFFPDAIRASHEMRRLIEKTYRRTGDVDACTAEIGALFVSRSIDAFLGNDIRRLVAGQMVRYIAKTIDGPDTNTG